MTADSFIHPWPIILPALAWLVLGLTAAVLWARSYRTLWHVYYQRSGRTPRRWRDVKYHLQLARGRVTVARTEFTAIGPDAIQSASTLRPAGRGCGASAVALSASGPLTKSTP